MHKKHATTEINNRQNNQISSSESDWMAQTNQINDIDVISRASDFGNLMRSITATKSDKNPNKNVLSSIDSIACGRMHAVERK